MFHVFTVLRATRVYHVGIITTGEPFPAQTRAGFSTIVHSFDDRSTAENYMWQLRDHYKAYPSTARQSRVRVRCFYPEGETTFESVAEAARANGVSSALISRHICDPSRYPHARGLRYERIVE